jgi:hypothetical protein
MCVTSMAFPRASAQYWRARAEVARRQANLMRDPDSKRAILEIAEDFDRMADVAEKRTRQTGKSETGDGSKP